MKDLISHFFLPNTLQHQKRYLRRGLYKTCNKKIKDFIFRIDDMAEYLKKFLPSGDRQRLPRNDILEILELSLPKEWQKQLIIQGFDSETQGLRSLLSSVSA